MVHSDYVQTLLEASGRAGMFVKDKDGSTDYFLLYLDEEFCLEEAVKLAEADAVCGVIRKGGGTRPRFALRFTKESDVKKFAPDNRILDTSAHAKWKVQGISPVVGACGPLAFLTERGFENIGILYQKDLCATFSAEVSGNINDSYYIAGGTRFHCVSKPPIGSPRTARKLNRKVFKLQSDKARLLSQHEVLLSSFSINSMQSNSNRRIPVLIPRMRLKGFSKPKPV